MNEYDYAQFVFRFKCFFERACCCAMPEIFRHQRATLLTTPTNVNRKKIFFFFLEILDAVEKTRNFWRVLANFHSFSMQIFSLLARESLSPYSTKSAIDLKRKFSIIIMIIVVHTRRFRNDEFIVALRRFDFRRV
jgi:hypothetical protein